MAVTASSATADSAVGAVSNTANPADGWTGFRFKADPESASWADFPSLGFDHNGVYLTANMYSMSDGSFVNRNTIAVPKSDLLSGTATVANRVRFTYAG